MSTLDNLESVLSSEWSLENLAVYGDHLMANGDLRGELVALDVHVATHGTDERLERRRNAVLEQWLGDDADLVRSGSIRVAFGFVEYVSPNAIERLIASAAGPYLRRTAGSTTGCWHWNQSTAKRAPTTRRCDATPRYRRIG